MKLNTNEKGDIILEDIYSGVELKTKDGESIKICMRDSGFEFNYMGVDYEAQKGVIRKRQDINAGETYTATLLMPDTIDANGNSYTKDCLVNAIKNFNKERGLGELDHPCPESENKLNYFLCSSDVIELFPQYARSNAIESGYEFDKDVKYYVAKLDFEYISDCYKTFIEPFEETDANLDFWCEECVEGTMNVDTLTIHNMSSNGLFKQIENKLGLTTYKNRAMTISNLAKKYNITPIEFINKIFNVRLDYESYNKLYSKPLKIKIKCCNNCSHFNYEPPQMYQPYPEFWCSKKHWEGICSKEECDALQDENDCVDYEESR